MEQIRETAFVHYVLENEVSSRAAAHISVAHEEDTMHPLYIRIR